MSKKPEFPKTVLVWHCSDEPALLLCAREDELEDVADGEYVAVYELKTLHRKRVKHSLD